MPKIRDLGISVIPATMRPTEIGGGAAGFGYWAQLTGCHPTEAEPGPCNPTPPPPPPCQPSAPQCNATPDEQCCPTESPASTKNTGAVDLPDSAVAQLRQQLQDQIGVQINAQLVN